MENDLNQTNESVATPTSPTPAPAGGSADDRLKGMQAALNRKHTEFVAKTSELESLLSAKDAEVATYRDKLTQIEAALREKSTVLADVMTKLSEKEAETATAAKFKIAAQKGLVKEFDEGLLRIELPTEEFTKHLDAFIARMSGTVAQAQREALTAASPPAGGTRELAATKAQLQQQLNNAVMNYSADPEAYEKAYKALMDYKE